MNFQLINPTSGRVTLAAFAVVWSAIMFLLARGRYPFHNEKTRELVAVKLAAGIFAICGLAALTRFGYINW